MNVTSKPIAPVISDRRRILEITAVLLTAAGKFIFMDTGCIQQFLVIALVAGNLQDIKKRTIRHTVAIITAALLFGAMHYPFYWLMLGTTILALLYGFLYLRSRNIYVMGIFHGWLGALFFYTVVGRDPFTEIFGKLIGQ